VFSCESSAVLGSWAVDSVCLFAAADQWCLRHSWGLRLGLMMFIDMVRSACTWEDSPRLKAATNSEGGWHTGSWLFSSHDL
jgi:hypothetical protein